MSNTVTNNEKWLELVADRVDNDIAARIDSIESNSNETCAKYGEDIQALCDTVTNNQKWLELVADRVDNGIAAHIDSIEKDLIEHNVKHEEEIHTLCNTINNNQKWLELLANRVDSNEKWLGTTNKRIDICNTFIDGNDNCSYSSYSQCGEDIIVQNLLERMETQPQKLSYLDIGGNDYKHLNNTYLMYSRGLSGVIIEANPFLADELKKHRSRDNVLNIGIGATKGELDFYIINGGGFSSFNKEFIDKTLANNPDATIDDVIKVKVLDFNTVVKQYCEGTPDIVSIDIEGDELSVLKSVDFEKYRPLVFIVESIYCTEHVDLNAKRYDIGEFMKSRGYHEYAFTGVNSIFVDTKRFNSVIGE